MNLQAIREALADAFGSLPDVRAFAWPVEQIPVGSASVVTIVPGSPYVDYNRAFSRGLAEVQWDATIYVQASDLRAAMGRMDALLSSEVGAVRSIIDQVMTGDRSLGGVVDDVMVDQASNIRAETLADGARVLCADLSIRTLVGR